jgi:subtilisin family serine protease
MNSVNTNPSAFSFYQSLQFQRRHRPKWILVLLLTLFSLQVIFGAQAWAGARAPIYGMDDPLRIPDQYVVVLKPGADVAASSSLQTAAISQGFTLDQRFQRAISGFTLHAQGPGASANIANALEALADNPLVAFIEADRRVYLSQAPAGLLQQNPVTWGLDRIDQTDLPLNNSYRYEATGAGVNVYVIDSGIRADHWEFGGRVLGGASFVTGLSALEDCTGHGTHVAGTIGSLTYGVAKAVNLWSVRVFDCFNSSSWTQILAALEWVMNNRQSPAVINMSLTGSQFYTANLAVENLVAAGIPVVAAAGNYDTDACNYSPASAEAALTVGATNVFDTRADFSNWGGCVDLFAPGEQITSTLHTTNSAIGSSSGTSMAAPHVTGVVALYRQQHPQATPADIIDAIKNSATRDKLLNTGSNSPNLLLFSEANGFVANFAQLYFRGDANHWSATPMNLVADHTWEVEITQASGSAMNFKFDVLGDWTHNYGDNNNDGEAEYYGNNISLPCPGSYRIRLNDANLQYSLINEQSCNASNWKRTIIFIEGVTQTNQDLFIRGGMDHAFAAQQGIECTAENSLCAIPIRHLNLRNVTTAPWKQGDTLLDWYGAEATQAASAQGSPLDWTTNFWPAGWGPLRSLDADGYGLTPLNLWGDHYWMLDVEMDCSRTYNGWFEFKSFISNGPDWEGNINQQNAPYPSNNHFAQCGRISSFKRNQNNPVWVGDF